MSYGRPESSKRPVRTLTLDLPVEVGQVIEDEDTPPLFVIGPLDGETPHTEYPRTQPDAMEINGGLVQFHFEEPFDKGEYKAVIYESRILDPDGDPVVVKNEDGTRWNSWRFQVYQTFDTQNPEPGEPIGFEGTPEPGSAPAKVTLDGAPVEDGQPELSGEVLSVRTDQPGQVSLEIESLWTEGRPTLYERHLKKVITTREEEPDIVSFVSAGPVDNHRWTHLKGSATLGRMPLGQGGDLALGSAVVRPPKSPANDPLFSRETPVDDSPTDDHPNTYWKTRYTVQPASVDAEIDSYQTRPLLSPGTINDEHNTPDTNPRLYPEGIWREGSIPGPTGEIAAFDLPLGSRLKITCGTETLWEGQSRLLPVLVSLESLASEIGVQASEPGARARILREVWKASKEALALWGTTLPESVTETMREFVLTRVKAGDLRTDKAHGSIRTSLGENRFQGASDRGLERRLAQLADRLRNGEPQAGLFSEDHVPGGSASLAGGTQMASSYREGRPDSGQRYIAPLIPDRVLIANAATRFQYL